ncbi:Spy/CpxP family protein refolding chaperone [Leptolyngbya sp. 'hensonii']|uniref:Spy/CpxP family protein refolding chaperone n=1 Tax=Leptolyngbya sp. 'hensonii' TaxID=1922337 RepID=UPI0015C53B8E|nr:Spy/CpxP family protein refolding chaperone [Leptolyngbya sp. 'hensonii']
MMFSIPIVVAPMVTTVAQAGPTSLTQLFPALEGIQLTPEQQAQLAALNNQTLAQIKSVLTPEQQSQFNAALSQGKGMQNALSSINLSMRQKRQLRGQLQNTHSQLNQILTPEQQQQLSKKVQTLQNQNR